MEEKLKPITQRDYVVNHRNYFGQLDRDTVKNHFALSEAGEYVLRPSSLGENHLVLTLMTQSPPKGAIGVKNKKGYYFRHFVFEPNDIKEIESGAYGEIGVNNVTRYIEEFCKHLMKPEFKNVSTLEEYESTKTHIIQMLRDPLVLQYNKT